MTSNEIRQKFLKFFESKNHKIIPSSSLVPNDGSVLFTTAGMQQFKPYYLNPESADKDFGIRNIATSQKCIRTGDIDEVGDNTHLTFFEMLGNFSFGGYGRKEAIEYAHEFITKEMGLEISYVTIYKGEGIVPKDEESKKIWENIDPNLKIVEDGSDVFWGPTGESGPCGPTTEIYCKNSLGNDIEIWNIVFNEYFCDGSRDSLDKGQASLKKLLILGIDTGMGLERLLTVVNKKESVYDTDLFISILNKMEELDPTLNVHMPLDKFSDGFKNIKVKARRIIADHAKAATFIIGDGVIPSNKESGYILRRLIRRIVKYVKINSRIPITSSWMICDLIIENYKKYYPNLFSNKENIINIYNEECLKFLSTINTGLKEFEKGVNPFDLYQSYGFPIELTLELAKEKGITVDLSEFNKKMEEHQKLSQTASAGMFKGGLANHSEKTIRLHTAHHLLLAALQSIVSPTIKQRGSNITEERLRIDFMFDRKLTDEEKKKVEDWVNDKIEKGLNVVRREMPLVEAEKLGAEMEFGAKYPEVVSVYFIEDENGNAISKEFCGGPHVENTKELGHFKIQKEEASSAGVRRIKAILD